MAASCLRRTLTGILLLLLVTSVSAQERGVAPLAATSHSGTGDYYALIIGNNAYQHWPVLQTARHDAQRLQEVLTTEYTFAPEHVRLLLDATRVDLLKGFDWLKQHSGPDDHVLIYYAGHGEYDEREDGYWVPVDASTENRYQHLSNSDLLTQIRAIDARHKLLISDSCFSGNLLTRGIVHPPAGEPLNDRYFEEKNRLRSVLGLTSGGNEPVSDGGARWNGNSIFAYHLLGQLEANRAPYLATSELALRLARNVSNDTQSATGSRQTPVFQAISNQGHQGGEFFFLRRPQAKPGIFLAFRKPPASGPLVPGAASALLEARIREELKGPFGDVVSEPVRDAEALRRQMLRTGVTQAVVWTLEGRQEQQASLIWKGMSFLDLKLEVWELRGAQLVSRGAPLVLGERLPYRTPPDSPEAAAVAFEQVAEKLLRFWEQKGAPDFFAELMP